MPNYCNNSVTFRHADPAMIQRVIAGYNRKGLFAEFFPCPQDLFPTGWTVKLIEEFRKTHSANIAKHGFPSWYEWAIANWGTKWDVGAYEGETPALIPNLDATAVQLCYETAWDPPIKFYEKMEALGFTIEAKYYEPGMQFCGSYSNGVDARYDVPNNSDLVDRFVPKEIDDCFAISENMDMHEQIN